MTMITTESTIDDVSVFCVMDGGGATEEDEGWRPTTARPREQPPATSLISVYAINSYIDLVWLLLSRATPHNLFLAHNLDLLGRNGCTAFMRSPWLRDAMTRRIHNNKHIYHTMGNSWKRWNSAERSMCVRAWDCEELLMEPSIRSFMVHHTAAYNGSNVRFRFD